MTYVALVSTEFETFSRTAKSLSSLQRKINDEFGKGWRVSIYDCKNEQEERLALQFGEGTLVKRYTKRA